MYLIDITQVTASAVYTLLSIVSNSVYLILTLLIYCFINVRIHCVPEFDAQKGKAYKEPREDVTRSPKQGYQ